MKSLPGSVAKHLHEQTNDYLKNSNIANRVVPKAGGPEPMFDHAQVGFGQPKSFSMKARSNAGEPHGKPSDLLQMQLGYAQAQSIGGTRSQGQHAGQRDA